LRDAGRERARNNNEFVYTDDQRCLIVELGGNPTNYYEKGRHKGMPNWNLIVGIFNSRYGTDRKGSDVKQVFYRDNQRGAKKPL